MVHGDLISLNLVLSIIIDKFIVYLERVFRVVMITECK